MRSGAFGAVAVVCAVLGAVGVLVLGKATGLLDDDRTETVFVPSDVREQGPNGGVRLEPGARPLAGNGFTPARIYEARSPGVLTVESFFDSAERHAAQGSGFVVSGSGHVLTSAHVITNAAESDELRGADRVYVGFKDGDRVPARIIGWDVYDDVGVLQVDPEAHSLSPVPLGDSSRVVVGEPVAAMGSPFGNQDSLAVGVVSATGRSIEALTSRYMVTDAIQTDAPITHGNSGGPLFDARGRVIGISAQIRTESGQAEGVGFAIPINAAKRSMRQLVANGRVLYAYVGVSTEDLTPSLARHLEYSARRGAIIARVEEGSPAAKAGLRAASGEGTFNGRSYARGGDVIVALDGKSVTGADDIVRAVAERLPGQVARLTILREGSRKVVPVTLGVRPERPEGGR
jgi:S1-C subfamily serine protease